MVCILALTKLALSRLVIDKQDLNILDRHMIEEKATIVDTIVRETDCEGVQVFIFHLQQFDILSLYKDHVTVYQYFVQEAEGERRETAELVNQIVSIQEQTIVNKNETWIKTTIKLRCENYVYNDKHYSYLTGQT